MSYRVFAIRTRPQDFSTVIGQNSVVSALSNALNKNKIHHAYLFTGTRGVGKTTISRILAKCFSCSNGVSANPCNKCDNCLAITAGKFLDLIEIDAASKTKVEDTRALLDTVIYAPSQGRYKIYLIDEVHMLSNHSFNALLKTLEEPPSHVKFLLATTDPQKIPATILSRCLQFTLKLVPSDIIAKNLANILTADGVKYEQTALELLANAAQGSVRDSLSLLEQAVALSGEYLSYNNICLMLGYVAGSELILLLKDIIAKNKVAVFERISKLALTGIDFGQLLTQLICMLHQIAILQQAPDIVSELEIALRSELVELATKIRPEDLQIYYQIALLAKRDLAYTPQPKMAVEMALIRMLSLLPDASSNFTNINSKTKNSATEVADNSSNKELKELAKSESQLVNSSFDKADKLNSSINQSTVLASNSSQVAGNMIINKENWPELVNKLGLKAVSLQIIKNCQFVSFIDEKLELNLHPRFAPMLNMQRQQEITDKVQEILQRKIKLTINKDVMDQSTIETPAAIEQEWLKRKRSNLVESLQKNPHINEIVNIFDGELKLDSIELIE